MSDSLGYARGLLFREEADVLRKELFQLVDKSLVVHQPILYNIWVHFRVLNMLPTEEHVSTGVVTCVCVGGGG